MTFKIDAVRQEFNAVSVDKDEALQKRLERLTRDRCCSYRKKVHNLQLELQHKCNGLGLTDPSRELEAIRFRSRMEAVQVLPPSPPFPSPPLSCAFQSLLQDMYWTQMPPNQDFMTRSGKVFTAPSLVVSWSGLPP